MNPAVGLRFFVVGGVILMVTGVLMLFMRPRNPREAGFLRYLNRSTIWAAFCVGMGVAAVLVGLGAVRLG